MNEADEKAWREYRKLAVILPNTSHIAQAAFLAGRASRDSELERLLDYWRDAQNIQLHAGEMTAQELRSVKAVVMAIKSGVPRQTLFKGDSDDNR